MQTAPDHLAKRVSANARTYPRDFVGPPRRCDLPPAVRQGLDFIFGLRWFDTLDQVQIPAQLVHKLLLAGSLIVVYGESNSGKTFLVLDLALAVAAGRLWHGLQTRPGLVIYIAGESAGSMQMRVLAYRKRHSELAGLPFAILPSAIDFLDHDSVVAMIAAIRSVGANCGQNPALVVVDTFARALPGGDENTAKDVGAVVAAADLIRMETGAAVLFVHHAGKDPSKGARGSSALRAAVDTEILIEKLQGKHVASVVKQRDLDAGFRFAFSLTPVVIGSDPEGTPITSCVVDHLEDAPAAAGNTWEFTGKAQRQFIAAMRERSSTEPNRIWSLTDLREVARSQGQAKSTARAVVKSVSNSTYMTQVEGGFLFTDGQSRGKGRNGAN